MTETEKTGLTVGQLVTVDGVAACYFRVTDIPQHGKWVDLYGGRLQRRGGIRAQTRAVPPEKVQPITSKAYVKRATDTLHAIDEAMESAPKPHNRAGGKK